MEKLIEFFSYQKVIVFGAQGAGKTYLIKSLDGVILGEDNYNYIKKNESKFN